MLRGIRWFLFELRIMRFPSKMKLLAVIMLLLGTSLYIALMYDIGTNRLRDGHYLELNSCPACYGRKLCNSFHSGAIKFAGFSQIPSLHFLNVKNVHRAIFKKKRIILKKLGHNDELAQADKKICVLAGKEGCSPGEALFRHKFQAEDVLHPFTVKGLSDLVACPSPRLMQRMDARFDEREEYLLHSEKLMIYMTLLVNPEPIVLQIFPSKEGWPFPEYFGACGRWVAVEEVPNPLLDFASAGWKKRLNLAKQIFEIADMFTNNKEGYALYWTDVDYDNYAVRENGKVVIVDAENILVVDKQKVRAEKPLDWNQPHYSQYEKCQKGQNCLAFQPDHLCQHLESDLNYYAVCKGILGPEAAQKGRPNLLHSIPPAIDDQYDLTSLLKECTQPSTPNARFLVKDKLLAAFDELLKGSPL